MNVNMKKPCSNCPFLKKGAISLAPGRMDGIIEDLKSSDHQNFMCHKTVHSKKGGDWDDEGNYTPSGKESMCMGSAAYMFKHGHPSVMLRIAIMFKRVTVEELRAMGPLVID